MASSVDTGFTPNPITKLFPLAVGAFGWQVHNLWIGLGILLLFLIVVIASNMQALFGTDETEDLVRKIQLRKWCAFILFMLTISISGAEHVRV